MRNAEDHIRSLVIVVPTYNDWDALVLLAEALDAELRTTGWRHTLLIVDDGSDLPTPTSRLARKRESFAAVKLLRLRRNLGHQRAIAIALAWVESQMECDAVLVMDGDGEDSPADIARLLRCYEETKGERIVFAARQRRSEGLIFQAFYHLYRAVHWILTGIGVRVGNFSLLPRAQLHRLIVVSDLWNHYAAAVFKARLPVAFVPTARAPRLTGRSKMNFTQLVVHGLSAISVFGDRVGVRLLFAAAVSSLLVLLLALSILLSSTLSAVAWSSKLLLLAAATIYLTFNLLVAITLFAFAVLGSRENAGFIPARDHVWFVDDDITLWASDE